jgi:hypothetical protein
LSGFQVFFLLLLGAGLLLIWRGSTEFLRAVGDAAFIAAVIALPADYLARRAFQADAFKASFGYLLAGSLRQELHWMLGLSRVCVNHTLALTFEEVDGAIKVTVREEREFQNQTAHTVSFPPELHLSDWHVEGHSPSVEWMRWDGRELASTLEQGDYSLVARYEPVSIPGAQASSDGTYPASSRASLRTRYIEWWPGCEGEFHQVYMTATEQPLVVVEKCPPWMRFGIAAHMLSAMGDASGGVARLDGPGEHRFNGALLPLQSIDVRWWREVLATPPST